MEYWINDQIYIYLLKKNSAGLLRELSYGGGDAAEVQDSLTLIKRNSSDINESHFPSGPKQSHSASLDLC